MLVTARFPQRIIQFLSKLRHSEDMNTLRIFLTLCMLSILVACGGTSGPVTVQPVAAFASLDQSAQDLIEVYDEVAFTAPNALPTSDNAAYAGFLGATIYNNLGNKVTRVVGQAAITLNFGASNITATGGIGNFVDETEGAVQGVLTLSQATLNRNGDPNVDPTFVAQATGLLRWPSALSRNIDVVLEGDLRGTDHAALGGEVLGQHSATGGNGQVVGSFILAR